MLISIHAPREGSDLSRMTDENSVSTFQSTLPVRGATKDHGEAWQTAEFQSTLPVRGATQVPLLVPRHHAISIHAPREGSDQPRRSARLLSDISIHAPPEGSDAGPFCGAGRQLVFQSTLPVRGATISSQSACPVGQEISIHAPREGSD